MSTEFRDQSDALDEVRALLGLGRSDWHPTFPGFRVLRFLGRGGFGSVWLAEDLGEGSKLVAIKLLDPPRSQAQRRRIELEERVLSELDHPHVVGLQGGIDACGTRALVLDYVPGGTLAQWIEAGRGGTGTRAQAARDTRARIRFACEVGVGAARGLGALHEQGVLHRDVKPSNVLLAEERVVLADLGLARTDEISAGSRSGVFLGTLAYAPPEAWGGPERRDERGDLYSLGLTLLHCASLEAPHPHELPRLLEDLERGGSPLERSFAGVLRRCLATNPDRRYGTAGELSADLQRILDGKPVHAPVLRPRRVRSTEWVFLALLALLVWSMLPGAGVDAHARARVEDLLLAAVPPVLVERACGLYSTGMQPVESPDCLDGARLEEAYSGLRDLEDPGLDPLLDVVCHFRSSLGRTMQASREWALPESWLAAVESEDGAWTELLAELSPDECSALGLAALYAGRYERARAIWRYALELEDGRLASIGTLLASLLSGELEDGVVSMSGPDPDQEHLRLAIGEQALLQGNFELASSLVGEIPAARVPVVASLWEGTIGSDDRSTAGLRGSARLRDLFLFSLAQRARGDLVEAHGLLMRVARRAVSDREFEALAARITRRFWRDLTESERQEFLKRCVEHAPATDSLAALLATTGAPIEEEGLEELREPVPVILGFWLKSSSPSGLALSGVSDDSSLTRLITTKEILSVSHQLPARNQAPYRRLAVVFSLGADRLGRGSVFGESTRALALAVLAMGVVAESSSAQSLVRTHYGEEAEAFQGSRIADIGDWNRDGSGDYLLSATGGSLGRGVIRAHSGRTGRLLFELAGHDPGDLYGISAAVMDDVDGDGRPDLVVGASGGDDRPGYVEVLSGRTGVAPIPERAGVRGLHPGFPFRRNALYRVDGAFSGARFGVSVAVHDDLDADGVSDLLVGASGSFTIGRGYVQAVSGADGSLIGSPIQGPQNGSRYGISITVIGDVDGGGLDDFVVGSSFSAGYVDVVSAESLTRIRQIPRPSGSAEVFGEHVQSVPDADGDGHEDVFVVSRGYGSLIASGHLFSGTGTFPEVWGVTGGSGHYWVSAEAREDLDCDGIPDVLVGAAQVNAPGGGYVRAFSGADGATLWTVDALEVDEAFGTGLAVVDDLNSDGAADLVVGAWGNGLGGTNAGAAYVYALPACAPAPREATSATWWTGAGRASTTLELLGEDSTSSSLSFELSSAEPRPQSRTYLSVGLARVPGRWVGEALLLVDPRQAWVVEKRIRSAGVERFLVDLPETLTTPGPLYVQALTTSPGGGAELSNMLEVSVER